MKLDFQNNRIQKLEKWSVFSSLIISYVFNQMYSIMKQVDFLVFMFYK